MANIESANPGKKSKKFKKKRFNSRKLSKQLLKEKRARLVAKNLPFKVTEDDVRKHFEQYGTVENVELLKRPDGKLVGCAFVQYKMVQFAQKAKHHTNNKLFMGRNLTVDFAKAKDKYVKEKEVVVKSEVKEEPVDEIKEEPVEIVDGEDNSDSEEDIENSTKAIEDDEASVISEVRTEKKAFESHDVNEGKTVFIKNVPFHATNEDLKQCMLQFGPVYYALICMDRLTEHSKGTAFVKFVNKEDAEKPLKAGTELTLLGNVLDCHTAIDRNDLKNKEKLNKELKSKPKDSRNLYLVKEGVILAGTKAAEGVSASDMAKRLQIEQYKTQMLRNLNTFVAKDRLVVHNLPATWDDAKLRALFQKHGGKGTVIKEARVMRDLRKLDYTGVGESKRFGFVTFNTHENALAALRSLNNNPNVFSKAQRPIICFSIESKTALKAKIRRQEKSRVQNPKSKDYKKETVTEEIPTDLQTDEDLKGFTGITAKAGVVQKMRSRYKLTQQAKLHYETLKKEKKQKKMAKKSLSEKKKDFIKQPKQKLGRGKGEDDNFSKMVSSYKKRLGEALQVSKKSKWYQD